MYQLSMSLVKRLRSLGVSETKQEELIYKYEKEAKEYIALQLPDFNLTENQINILSDTYIQYQLFSFLELETLVADKKIFLDDVIEKIRENKTSMLEKDKEKARIRVF